MRPAYTPVVIRAALPRRMLLAERTPGVDLLRVLGALGGGIVLVESTPLGLPAFPMELVWFYSLTAFRVATTISIVAGLMPALKPQVWPRLQSYVRNK